MLLVSRSRSTSRSDGLQSELEPRGVTPAGWYEVAGDPTRLRYWDGAAWTNGYAHRAGSTSAIAADWYPDPSNAAQLRYWDGSVWTHHVSPRPGVVTTPADWYQDPSNAAQLRWWDGTAWTAHVTAGRGAAVGLHRTALPTSPHGGLASTQADPRIQMSSAEWQAHVEAWARAGAIQQELWSRLTNARITDAGENTLEAQRRWEALTPAGGCAAHQTVARGQSVLASSGRSRGVRQAFRGSKRADRSRGQLEPSRAVCDDLRSE